MRYYMGIILALIILTGCMSSIFSIHEFDRQKLKIRMVDGDSLEFFVMDANERELVGISLTDEPARYKSEDFGKTYQIIEGSTTTLRKNRIASIKDLHGNDISQNYLLNNLGIVSAKSLTRIAEIQTNLYNIYIVSLTISIIAGIILVAAIK